MEEEIKRGKGRPKGAKNKPKRGRPKGSTTKKFEHKVAVPIAPPTPRHKFASEEEALDYVLSEDKLTDVGYNISTDKIINQEPIDASYYYRGSKNVPIAAKQTWCILQKTFSLLQT